MGVLRLEWSKAQVALGRRGIVGRTEGVFLSIPFSKRVSREHAVIQWRDQCWQICDLGSRNGTWVDGKRISAHAVALREGSRIGFGSPELQCQLIDAGPPQGSAFCPASVERRHAVDGVLSLPCSERPLAIVAEDERGWVLIQGEVVTLVEDGHVLVLGECAWTLELPPPGMLRAPSTESIVVSRLDACTLVLQHSLDEESVTACLRSEGRVHDLQQRAHHTLLLHLARVRLADREAKLPLSERGWVFMEDLCRELAASPEHLNLMIWRVRTQLSALGILDAQGIVERRPRVGQLRLGVVNCEVLGPG